MNRDERHQYILKELETFEKIMVSDLAKALNVTRETIRKDLADLEMNEHLTRIHGGAVPFIPTQKEMVYERKMSVNYDAKLKIAQKAAELIQHGDTIAVDVGTTTVHIADMIEDIQSLTVVTNSLSAAIRFNLAIEEKRISGQVIMLGGITHPEQSSVKGPYTVDLLKRFHFDRAFISCGGVTKGAVYDFDMDESLVSEMMIQNSNEPILLTDSSKLNKKSLFEISPISNFTKIISDQEKPLDWAEGGYEWISITDSTVKGKEETNESRLSYTS